ncbi:tyrosine--tRNA ligase [Candidatus Woesearchaeota archaeon]|nr:tyrosine--tRNA ligase [Candidatus Woesearchaeota archaeon]MBW3016501.1 tyrosine--tRNA ligase [Candidatus Woesearchaeota archaeon]
MDAAEKFELITRNLDEVLMPDELKALIQSGVPLRHYIGFEISGYVHLGTGLATGRKIADFQKAGVKCSIYLATYHAWINNKLGGNLDTIRRGANYFKEGLIAGMLCAGADPDKVKFVSGDELYHHNDDFWRMVIDIAKNTTLNRSMRATTIMGRQSAGEMPLAWLMYAPMQVADIFIQDFNIAHAGMDQRKAHVMAREVGLKIMPPSGKPYKPVALHQHLILGLQKPAVWPVPKERMQELWSQMKMSKSVPGSAVYVHDEPDEIRKKINNAFCPEGEIEFNPILDWAQHLIFSGDKAELVVKRPAKFGGDVTFTDFVKLQSAFAEKKLHPVDLKKAVSESIIEILEPARKHFAKPKVAKLKKEMDGFVVTR